MSQGTFIKPSFVKNKPGRDSRKTRIIRKPNIEIEDATNDYERPSDDPQKSLLDTIKEHKILIITFAIVIFLLIFVILWMVTKDDKKLPPKNDQKHNPNKAEHQTNNTTQNN